MGNHFICMTKKDQEKQRNYGSRGKRMSGSSSNNNNRSQRKMLAEEEMLHRQALSLALQQHQLSQRFDGSMSRRVNGSTSSRRLKNPCGLSDRFDLTPEFLENLKSTKFVLIHGEGFGAWCWYKIIAMLEESGLVPVAIDLAGSGIDQTDTNSITTLAEYSKPLINYLEKIPENEKVILVGHSSGGACVSYAMEHFPEKISKAIFLCATMVSDGQQPFGVYAEQLGSAERFMQESQSLIYGNGKDKPPTGFMFEKEQIKFLYLNQSPSKDVSLAMVSMRPSPLGPIMEKMSLTPEGYGKGRRFFIQTLEDRALLPDVQEKLVRENQPERVFKIKGSDHCPFFSKPQSLHKTLIEIAQIE